MKQGADEEIRTFRPVEALAASVGRRHIGERRFARDASSGLASVAVPPPEHCAGGW